MTEAVDDLMRGSMGRIIDMCECCEYCDSDRGDNPCRTCETRAPSHFKMDRDRVHDQQEIVKRMLRDLDEVEFFGR